MTKTEIKKVSPFRDLEGKTNIPARTMHNAMTALGLLKVECTYDAFHDKRLVAGQVLGSEIGQVSDDTCLLIRQVCREKLQFDPGKDNTWDAINLTCRHGSFNPILDYLDSLTWDRVTRLDTWMQVYMGAPDTPFIRAVGRMMLIASVRRIRRPGCKFDYLCVLESGQGKNKSSALATLYGLENFSDQSILNLSDKELQEATRGRWAMEAADLSGIRRGDVETIKAQLSRQTDRARPAYGRAVIDTPRQCVFWGTTNDTTYLRDQTGNRRFLPVAVGRIDVAAIKRDRDELWAEASIAEGLDMDIMLPEELWEAAGVQQAARTQSDPWIDELANVAEHAARCERANAKLPSPDLPIYELCNVRGNPAQVSERIASRWLLSTVLGITIDRQTPEHTHRLARVMEALGWSKRLIRFGEYVCKGYVRRRPRETWE
jgi:hypothetical protein